MTANGRNYMQGWNSERKNCPEYGKGRTGTKTTITDAALHILYTCVRVCFSLILNSKLIQNDKQNF